MIIGGAQFAAARQTVKNSSDISEMKLLRVKPSTKRAALKNFRNARKSNKKVSSGRDKRKQEEIEEVAGVAERSSSPIESRLDKAGSFEGDIRSLPKGRLKRKERPEREDPESPVEADASAEGAAPIGSGVTDELQTSAPSPLLSFNGLDYANWGAGRPPDTSGDVGKDYFIQAINSAVGIYRKSDGARIAAFTLNAFMSQGNFGNLCDTNNFGDPVVLYDTFEDRWIISDFAFQLDGANNVVNPPGNFQCFAVSKTGDPVAGGWNFYSVNTTGGLGDYPKLGVWTDGIYMMVNIFGYNAESPFQQTRVYALNKAQMYAGNPAVQVISFNAPSDEFTILPANARLQTGTPPADTPNYFSVVWKYTNVVSVYKFKADWNRISLSSFTGPFNSTADSLFAASPSTVPARGGNNNDTMPNRLMMQNQYTNIGGVESLWNTHSVMGGTSVQSAVRYYQMSVTGGTVGAAPIQAATYNPDTSNRYIPSLAVNKDGDMALSFTASSSSLYPSIRYTGRLANDPINTITQTETDLIAGSGSQDNSNRWGDYSTMTLDPDGCTFWFTSEYYAAVGGDWQTRIGSFRYPSCTPVGSNGGAVQGTITAAAGGTPISGATVSFGSRTATTDANGNYSFVNIPAGIYPMLKVSFPGKNTASATAVTVADGTANTINFALTSAPTSGLMTDTTTADFQLGIAVNADLTTNADNLILGKPGLDQQNASGGTSVVGFNGTSYAGQTFTPAVTGTLTKIELNLLCSGCTGTTPDLRVSIRATNNKLPTGVDLAAATISGFSSGTASFYAAVFSSPPTLTAGQMYVIAVRPTANPSPGIYALTRGAADVYAGGTRVVGASSGTNWSIPMTGGSSTDANFRTYMESGYLSSGELVSGVKDANPAAGRTANWNNLVWNGSTPAGTAVRFQFAASNSSNGPFNFVGPDGTAATFYTASGTNLSGAFNTRRYLKYKVFLSTTVPSVTPILGDVSIGFSTIIPTASEAQMAGRVTVASGKGVSGATILLTDQNGATFEARTNFFGHFRFSGLLTGQSYTVEIKAKGYAFEPKVLFLTDEMIDLIFIADSTLELEAADKF